MRRLLYVSALFLLTLPAATSGEDAPKARFTEFNVLWDRVSGLPKCTKNGDFADLGNELQAMGASITELFPSELYRDEVLEDIDLVIICYRKAPLGPIEQETLVRYVRNGGSLLVITKHKDIIAVTYPVLINFGIEILVGYLSTAQLNEFVHPATTERRPVELCKVSFPHKIVCSNKARAIAGYSPASSPTGMDNCIMALGGRSGKGRVIVISNTNIWATNPVSTPAPGLGIALWGEEDNADLFRNTVEYLVGASDLQLKKLISKGKVTAGKSTTFKTKVKNLESCYSRQCVLAYYLSTDNTLGPTNATEVGRTQIPEIKGKRAKLIKYKAEIPSDLESGEYNLLVEINPDEDPLEINENNNLKAKKINVY